MHYLPFGKKIIKKETGNADTFKTDSLDTGNRSIFLPRVVTFESYSRSFQHKILNHILYLNKKFFSYLENRFHPFLCSFCKLSDQTVLHLFYECDFALFDLTPQSAFVGFLHADSKLLLTQNHLLLISKIYIYNSRRSES